MLVAKVVTVLTVVGVARIHKVALLVDEDAHNALLSRVELEEVVVFLETGHGLTLDRLHLHRI